MTTKLRAEIFWTDRWDRSLASLLPMEARGLYREMLTQAWRRGAQLPASHEAIRFLCRCTDEVWARCWPLVEPYWQLRDGVLVNETQLDVYGTSLSRYQVAVESGRRGGQQRVLNAASKPQATLKGSLKRSGSGSVRFNHSVEAPNTRASRAKAYYDKQHERQTAAINEQIAIAKKREAEKLDRTRGARTHRDPDPGPKP